MLALIQNEVVENHAWMTAQEFTDIVALSQMTPGPVGINVATYAGYTAVVNAGYTSWVACLSALMSSFAVVLLPFLLILFISHYLMKHKEDQDVKNIFSVLRPTIVGVIASAAILLSSFENFGHPSESAPEFIVSCLIFIGVFIASFKFKKSPIMLILISGLVGIIVYMGILV